jgi:Ser/Thr protein kinase RdoA (MazF antagonist)
MASVKAWLPEHLEATYGVGVKEMAPLEPWGPEGAQRVDLASGESWVARPHGPQRPVAEVRGDAEVLRFLEEHDFPAERLAHAEPVSRCGESSVIVTKLLPGRNCRSDGDPKTLNGIARLLGQLHTLPLAEGAVSRPAGGWHHLSQAGGGRDEDVRILLPLLADAASRLPDSEQSACRELAVELESADLCRDLPHCFINVDFGGPNVIKWRDKLFGIDWTGSGRGPRIHSLAIFGVGAMNPRLVDAVVAGYREYVSLESEELDRLPGAMVLHGLVLQAWGVAFRGAMPSSVLTWLSKERELAELVAERTREAFQKNDLSSWTTAPDETPLQKQPTPLEILTDAVNGKSDSEVEAFSSALGGMEQLCGIVFRGLGSRPRRDASDFNVGFILGDSMGWVVRSTGGKVTVAKRIAKRAPALVHATPVDFLRVITGDLDFDAAVADGRIELQGDPTHVATLFAATPR